MTAPQIYMRQNDTAPAVTATLEKLDGTPVDISGAAVRFVMRNTATGAIKVDHAVAAIVSPTAGTVSYAWSAGDTDTVGTFSCGFVVTFADSTKRSFPSDGLPVNVVIAPAL